MEEENVRKRKLSKEQEDNNDNHSSASEDVGDQETVDVDFEFFDPKEIDFHGIKSLLRQTFANDADVMPASALAEIIIAQAAVGSTVKVVDEQDPYALMTVLGFAQHGEAEGVKEVKAYLSEKARKAGCGDQFDSILPDAGWIINERLINMPAQIVPPMLKMLLEEAEWAVEDGGKFAFDHFVYISKIYKEIESDLVDEEEGDGMARQSTAGEQSQRKKKKKKAKVAAPTATFYFQPEDEVVAEHASFTFDFKFTKELQSTDSRRAFQEFGIDPLRRVFIIEQSKMKGLLQALETALASAS
ncbi:Mss4p nuclear export [Thoreauomyces humboldtii]|nr:Mss4p nuclear export [Thoreauomyces humboldtii]